MYRSRSGKEKIQPCEIDGEKTKEKAKMWIRSNTFVLGPIFSNWDYSFVFCFHVSAMPDREPVNCFHTVSLGLIDKSS